MVDVSEFLEGFHEFLVPLGGLDGILVYLVLFEVVGAETPQLLSHGVAGDLRQEESVAVGETTPLESGRRCIHRS